MIPARKDPRLGAGLSGRGGSAFSAAVTIALAIGLAACARSAPLPAVHETSVADLQPAPLAAGERLRVVATTTIAADITRGVAGDAAEVTPLLAAGIDPHAYEPAPRDLRAAADADVVFINGLGLEEFLAELLANAGGAAPVVSLSEGIEPRSLDEGGGGSSADPHVWLDPTNVIAWVRNLEAALTALDPVHASEYAENAGRVRSELERLDAEIHQALAPIPPADRLLVTDHDEFGYFAEEYGFTIVGTVIPGFSSAAEPSAGELASLEDVIRETGARAIFVSAVVSPGLAQRVADDTGARLVTLYAHALTEPDGPAADYLSLMRYNVQAIASALVP